MSVEIFISEDDSLTVVDSSFPVLVMVLMIDNSRNCEADDIVQTRERYRKKHGLCVVDLGRVMIVCLMSSR